MVPTLRRALFVCCLVGLVVGEVTAAGAAVDDDPDLREMRTIARGIYVSETALAGLTGGLDGGLGIGLEFHLEHGAILSSDETPLRVVYGLNLFGGAACFARMFTGLFSSVSLDLVRSEERLYRSMHRGFLALGIFNLLYAGASLSSGIVGVTMLSNDARSLENPSGGIVWATLALDLVLGGMAALVGTLELVVSGLCRELAVLESGDIADSKMQPEVSLRLTPAHLGLNVRF